MKKLKEQIAILLDDPKNHDDARRLLPIVRENLSETEASIRWSTGWLFFLMLASELMNRGVVDGADVVGFKIKDLTLIDILLPLGIGYFYYTASSFYSVRSLLIEVHNRITRSLLPAFYDTNLDLYNQPPSSFHALKMIAVNVGGWQARLMATLSIPLMLALAIGPAVFEGYTLCKVFVRLQENTGLFWHALFWAVAALSLLFVVQAMLFMIGLNRIAPAEK